MTTYDVQWGGNKRAAVTTVDELDQVIAEIEQQRGAGDTPFHVSIGVEDKDADPFEQGGLDVGIGHPDRAFAFWAGEGPGGYGQETGVPPTPEIIAFDLAGEWTQYYAEETQINAETAKVAAREYIATGRRPTCLEWTA